MIIDTHCHLDDTQFADDLDEVVLRASKGGVKGIVIPGADIHDLERAQTLAHR